MAIRTALLNWNNITRDTDFSKYIESVSDAWVIEWLTVTASQVAIWKAFVPCLRTNGDTIFALVSVTAPVSISGNGDVFIQVSQTYIDNWELANEDWTGIATISVWTMPAKNALKLAVKSWSTITDARVIIPKVWELDTYIKSLQTRMNEAEQAIDELEEQGAVDHLEETGLVWELYTLSNTLFKQATPSFANSTIDCNVWDVASNTAIHIQRIANGTASNKLKLKVKKVWAPTTWLVIEVRRWVEVDVSSTEAYWYGNELVCSGSIPYSSIDTTYGEFEVTMNWQFGWTKGELLDIVVYQTWSIVNSTNYYCIACDSTQYSEWFSYVAVNGSTRTRSKLMPYCIADWFSSSLLCKTGNASVDYTKLSASVSNNGSQDLTYTTTKAYWKLYISVYWTFDTGHKPSWSSVSSSCFLESVIYVNNTQVWTYKLNSSADSWTIVYDKLAELSDVPSGATIKMTTHVYWSRSTYNYSSWTLTYTVPWNLPVIIRKLIPNEVKSIWQQATATSYWQLPNGQRYWEFPADTSSSATSWSITLWNCVGFKTIIDSWWNKWKVPVYKE